MIQINENNPSFVMLKGIDSKIQVVTGGGFCDVF
jgi:hypothetical protein